VGGADSPYPQGADHRPRHLPGDYVLLEGTGGVALLGGLTGFGGAIRPLIDRVFEFEDADEAFDFYENGDFMGKVVIRL
jgi:hypothetical protein